MNSNNHKKSSNETIKKNRRSFLKKAVYAAPTLLVLGSLVRPTSTFAESRPVGTPCTDDPNDLYPPCN